MAQCVTSSRVIYVTRAGLVHIQGPIGNCCPSSQCLPAASAPSSSSSTALPSSAPQSPPSSSLSGITDLPPWPAVKILKRVPHTYHKVAPKKLATVVDNVVNCNDHGSWVRLQRFPARCLRVPQRGGHRRNLASQVILQVSGESNNAILKLDFSNAFNSIHRDIMLKAVEDLAPELLRFMHSIYSAPSPLFWEDECLLFCEGVQQGDRLGPLLFCLTLHQLSIQLRSELCLFYLDDGTLGGSEDDILHDLDVINNAADDLGLMLNMQKCELITCSSTIRDSILSISPQLQVTMPDSVSLLGLPLGDINCISDTIQLKDSNLQTIGVCLKRMHAHDALQFLRHSFGLPKMMHILHTAPCFLSSCLNGYDDLVPSI